MHKWIVENWQFTITATDGRAKNCRLGFEKGDEFQCEYAVPSGFCPKTMPVLHTLCEIIRCGGDFTHRGSDKPYEIDFSCADGTIRFHLAAKETDT